MRRAVRWSAPAAHCPQLPPGPAVTSASWPCRHQRLLRGHPAQSVTRPPAGSSHGNRALAGEPKLVKRYFVHASAHSSTALTTRHLLTAHGDRAVIPVALLPASRPTGVKRVSTPGLQQVLTGRLPTLVKRMIERPGAWLPR